MVGTRRSARKGDKKRARDEEEGIEEMHQVTQAKGLFGSSSPSPHQVTPERKRGRPPKINAAMKMALLARRLAMLHDDYDDNANNRVCVLDDWEITRLTAPSNDGTSRIMKKVTEMVDLETPSEQRTNSYMRKRGRNLGLGEQSSESQDESLSTSRGQAISGSSTLQHSVSHEAKRMPKDDKIHFSWLSHGAATAQQTTAQKVTIASIQHPTNGSEMCTTPWDSGMTKTQELAQEAGILGNPSEQIIGINVIAESSLQPSEVVAPIDTTPYMKSVLHGAKRTKGVMDNNTVQQPIHILDDCETFTTPHTGGMSRCKETEYSNNPKEQQTNDSILVAVSVQKSEGNVSNTGQSFPLPEESMSGCRIQEASAKSTLQSQPPEAVIPVYATSNVKVVSHEEEKRTKGVSMDKNFNCASSADGGNSVQQIIDQMQTVARSLKESEELHVSENSFDDFVQNLDGTLPKVGSCSVAASTQVSTSLDDCNVVGDNNNDQTEDNTSRNDDNPPFVASSALVTTSTETLNVPEGAECHNMATINTNLACVAMNSNGASPRREDRSEEILSNGAVRTSHQHHSITTSLNLTEMVEQMGKNDIEVDSASLDSSLTSVEGYNVKPEYAGLVASIISNHGDIAAECSLGSVIFRSTCMEVLCVVLQRLMKTDLNGITIEELEEMKAAVCDIEKQSIDVKWLKNRLDEISEAKKAIPALQQSSSVRQYCAGYESNVKRIKMQLKDYKNKIAAAESELLAVDAKFEEAMKTISECKAKFRPVAKLSSLVHGLVKT